MRVLAFTRQIAKQWIAHNNTRSSAAIAFYAIFTLAPTLVLATVVASRFVSREDARRFVEDQLAGTIGAAGERLAEDVYTSVTSSATGSFAVLSSILLLYGASTMFYHIRSSLNLVFECKQRSSNPKPIVAALVGRLLAALFVLGTGGLLVVMLLLNVALKWLDEWLAENTSLAGIGWHVTGGATSIVVTLIVFVALLKLLPANRPRMRHVLPAAAIAVALFETSKWLIGLYISNSVIASAYGPSSSIVAIVLWVFCTAQILLLGAEICKWSLDRETKR